MVLDQVAYEHEASGIKYKLPVGAMKGAIVYEYVKNPNRTGCNVLNKCRQLKFLQIQGSH